MSGVFYILQWICSEIFYACFLKKKKQTIYVKFYLEEWDRLFIKKHQQAVSTALNKLLLLYLYVNAAHVC